jgi:CSLREA domain-containing protein
MRNKKLSLSSIGYALFAILSCQAARADVSDPASPIAVYRVTKTADSNDGVCNNDCSLREALAAAITGAQIEFVAAFHKEPNTIQLSHGELLIKKNVRIVGPGATLLTISGTGTNRVLLVEASASAAISGVTLLGGRLRGSDGGAGVRSEGSLRLTQSRIFDNQTEHMGVGGAIWSSGALEISDSEIAVNEAGQGGAIYASGLLSISRSVLRENYALRGGAIFTDERSSMVSISETTLRNNTAVEVAGAVYLAAQRARIVASTLNDNIAGANGGGIYFASTSSFRALQLSNSTLSNNSGGRQGGAVFAAATAEGRGYLEVSSCTFAANEAAQGASIFTQATALAATQTMLRNSVFFATAPRPLSTQGETSVITSEGFNLSNELSSRYLNQSTDLLGRDPLLAPLANNGGLTWTHALAPNSPAIDVGFAFGLSSDQRGFRRAVVIATARSAGDYSDIGAVEMQAKAGALSVEPL